MAATPSDHPVSEPLFTNLLVRRLVEEHREAPELEHAFDTLIRHSDAGSCARKIGLKALGYPPSEQFDAAGVWVTWLGTTIHEALQGIIAEAYGSAATIEAKVRWDDLSASGHIDALVDIPDDSERGFRRVCLELKSGGGFAFDKAVGLNRKGYQRGNPEGPRASAKLQGALNAVASDSDELRIGMISLEAVSKQLADKVGFDDEDRILAEWAYPRSVFEPWAERERKRFRSIIRVLNDSKLPDRWALSDDMAPVKLDPTADRRNWQCSYCSYRTLCTFAGPGEPALPIPGVPVP